MTEGERPAGKAFQDSYPDDLSHCYGCGRLNEHGLRLKSYWSGDETVLHVEFVSPTPLGVPLEVRGRVREITERKVIVGATVSAGGQTCARGEVVAVRMPERMMPHP
jgi:hypothetical protein